MRKPLLVLALLLTSCASTGSAREEVRTVASWLEGLYLNDGQVAENPRDFRPIRLVMKPCWKDRDDGPWLYVEQAVVGHEDKPYRQRVYHVVPDDGDGVRCDVYELPGDPLAHAGDWNRPAPLADVTPQALVPRTGCSVHLRRVAPDRFEGATRGEGCASTLAGAKFATSEVTLTMHRLESLDRGWSAPGQQVWGSENGPYRFLKRLEE